MFDFITIGFFLMLTIAWVTNLGWLISNGLGDFGGEVVVSLFGIFFFPIGMIHGIYLWF